MKKYISILIAGILLVVVLVGANAVFNNPKKSGEEEVTATTEPLLNDISSLTDSLKPVVDVKATSDKHTLVVNFSNLGNFKTLEYELTYLTKDEIPQGVPSSPVDLNGSLVLERELLLGTCSGTVTKKCRYDEQVHEITFTVRYTDKEGNLYTQSVKNIVL